MPSLFRVYCKQLPVRTDLIIEPRCISKCFTYSNEYTIRRPQLAAAVKSFSRARIANCVSEITVKLDYSDTGWEINWPLTRKVLLTWRRGGSAAPALDAKFTPKFLFPRGGNGHVDVAGSTRAHATFGKDACAAFLASRQFLIRTGREEEWVRQGWIV